MKVKKKEEYSFYFFITLSKPLSRKTLKRHAIKY